MLRGVDTNPNSATVILNVQPDQAFVKSLSRHFEILRCHGRPYYWCDYVSLIHPVSIPGPHVF